MPEHFLQVLEFTAFGQEMDSRCSATLFDKVGRDVAANLGEDRGVRSKEKLVILIAGHSLDESKKCSLRTCVEMNLWLLHKYQRILWIG